MTTDDKNLWKGDLLDFQKTGETFTSLIKSIDGSKVISIEAGFGRGKTFFRERWAKHLRDEGEVVVEIDARRSDHSGDPVVTFIGALVAALGKDDKTRMQKAKDAGLKYTGVAARVLAKAVLRQGADDLIDAVEGQATDSDDSEILKSAVEGVGKGMSKFAADVIAAQLEAEKARQAMPEQLDALREALTEEFGTDRVMILIDELDRCHPDYAIALLEAMKLVFDRPGYVFVLMVNSDHLERIAAHRFVGWHKDEEDKGREPYLDKFVDMRLKLPAAKDTIGEAARALALKLPEPGIPFGEGPEFTIERAAQVAADLAPISGLSMRQIKRVLLRVQLAVRCYREVPLDVPLLVWLGFSEVSKRRSHAALPRSQLTKNKNDEWKPPSDRNIDHERRREIFETNGYERRLFVQESCAELVLTAQGLHRLGHPPRGKKWEDHYIVLAGLGPWYIPEHQAMLDAVHQIVVD